MKSLEKYKVILWDFDGVILDSMKVRADGFKWVLQDYPQDQVSNLILFHECNGGLSRYVKFRYFFNQIRNEPVEEDTVKNLSELFSRYMKERLTAKELLIQDSLQFLVSQFGKKDMHIVSGSDQNELRFLSKELEIVQFFQSINGSPTPKSILISELVHNYRLHPEQVLLIGDSINDLEAAKSNSIDFAGYNNPDLQSEGVMYIHSFTSDFAVN